MTVDTKKLRELASKATFESSIWESENDAPQLWIDNRENNAAWCRAANPQAIIALLDRLKEAEDVVRFYANRYKWFGPSEEIEEHRLRIENYDSDLWTEGLYTGGKRARQYLEKWKGEK
jgi:hypothetical protein